MNRFDQPAVDQPGGVYCSPWCGAKCLRIDYDNAVKDAASAARLMGDGWEPRVWENLGWHWSIEKGSMSIHPTHDHAYGRKPDGRFPIIGWTAYFIHGAWPGDTAHAAYKAALTAAAAKSNDIIVKIQEVL